MEGLALFILIWLIWGSMLLALLFPVGWCLKSNKNTTADNKEQSLYAKICKCRLRSKKLSARHMIE